MADLVIPKESRPVFDYHINKANNNPMANAYKSTQNKTLEDIRKKQIAQGIIKPVVEKVAEKPVQNNTTKANTPRPQVSTANPMAKAYEAAAGKTQEEIEQAQEQARAKHLSTITANDDKTAMALNNAGDMGDLGDELLKEQNKIAEEVKANEVAEVQPKATAKASAPKPEETAEEQPKTPLEILKSYAGNIGEYLKSPNFRSNSAAVLSDFANSLAQNQPQGQMIDGHFVANTGLGSQLNDMPVVTKQRRQQEFENDLKTQQLADAKEARMQDIALRNEIARQNREAKERASQQDALIKQTEAKALVDSMSRALGYSDLAGANYQGTESTWKNLNKWWDEALSPNERAQAWSNYTETLDNVIYPRLKEILGGQFTQDQGEKLMSTLRSQTASKDERERVILDFTNKALTKLGYSPLNSVQDLASIDQIVTNESKRKNRSYVE